MLYEVITASNDTLRADDDDAGADRGESGQRLPEHLRRDSLRACEGRRRSGSADSYNFV